MKKSNDVSLKDALGMLVEQNRWKEKLDRVKVADVWKEQMGETIAKYTKHVTLRKDTLVLLIESAPLKQELSYSKPKIIKLMNDAFGEEIVKSVLIH